MVIPTTLGWQDKKVRNRDGREGTVTSEYVGFGFVNLTISVPGGRSGHVQLNTQGFDSGGRGWEWFCENFAGGARWLKLGDFEEDDDSDLTDDDSTDMNPKD